MSISSSTCAWDDAGEAANEEAWAVSSSEAGKGRGHGRGQAEVAPPSHITHRRVIRSVVKEQHALAIRQSLSDVSDVDQLWAPEEWARSPTHRGGSVRYVVGEDPVKL